MKKLIVFVLFLSLIYSCTSNDPNLELKILPVKSAIVPAEFQYRTVDTLVLKYDLPNACYSFRSVYYEIERNSRIVAINALLDNEISCTQATIEQEIKIPVHVLQEEDYVFRFYKGKDTEGNSIFDNVTVPVN